MQIRIGRAMALAVFLRHLIEACAVLSATVEIRVGGNAQLLGCGEKRTRERIHAAKIGDVQWPVRSVVFRGAALLPLGFLEVGKNVLKSPAIVAETRPTVVVGRIAA